MRSLTQTKAKSTFTPIQSGLLQRRCASCDQHTIAGAECAECQKKRSSLQRRSTNQAEVSQVPPIVHEVLNSPGQPLNTNTRTFMESRFGYDFSQVRVHADAKAAESARAVNALAYTVGRDVVFEQGQYIPETTDGKRLLAHELAHVVQQSNNFNFSTSNLSIGSSDSSLEDEANHLAREVSAEDRRSIGWLNPSMLVETGVPKRKLNNQTRPNNIAFSKQVESAGVVQRQTDSKRPQQMDDPCSVDKIWGTWDAMKELLCATGCSLNPFADKKCKDKCSEQYGVWSALQKCRKSHPLPPPPDIWEETP